MVGRGSLIGGGIGGGTASLTELDLWSASWNGKVEESFFNSIENDNLSACSHNYVSWAGILEGLVGLLWLCKFSSGHHLIMNHELLAYQLQYNALVNYFCEKQPYIKERH